MSGPIGVTGHPATAHRAHSARCGRATYDNNTDGVVLFIGDGKKFFICECVLEVRQMCKWTSELGEVVRTINKPAIPTGLPTVRDICP
jgi:hypothetical protein